MRRRTRLALACAAALTLGAPASAHAHASLAGTSPAGGAVVATAPRTVVFRFSEPVEGRLGAVRVFDAQGRRADTGPAFHPGDVGSALGTHLRGGLAKGTYTATYRVISEDGHIVGGGFGFSIGHASATRDTVGDLVSGARSGPGTSFAFGVTRALEFAAIAVGVGVLAFLLVVWWPALTRVAGSQERWRDASEAFAARALQVLGATAIVGALGALVALVLEGATAQGVSFWSALHARVLQDVVQTRFGGVWEVGLLAWLAVGAGVLLLGAAQPARLPVLRRAYLGPIGLAPSPFSLGALALLAVPLAYLILLPALGGHGATQQPVAVELPANVVHVAAASVWTGGLLALVAILPAALRRLERDERAQLLAATVARFSPFALAAVVAIAVTGLAQALVEVRTPAHLFDTGFGRLVAVKALLLCALVFLGYAQRSRNIPRLERLAGEGASREEAGGVLRRTLVGELVLVAAVFGVTAALSAAPPSTAAPAGPYSATATIGRSDLRLTVAPARTGPNSIDLYLTDAANGRPATSARQVEVVESLPARGIPGVPVQARRAGPGHYVVGSAQLAPAGEWRLTITVRTSEFDESVARVTVPVR